MRACRQNAIQYIPRGNILHCKPARAPNESEVGTTGGLLRTAGPTSRSPAPDRGLAPARAFGGLHAQDQVLVVLIPVGLQIQIRGHSGQPLITDVLDVALHETVIGAPQDTVSTHRGFFRPRRYLMGVEIMQVELINKCFFHRFVQDQVAVDCDLATLVVENLRQVAIDINRPAIQAVAGQIGDVVATVEPDATAPTLPPSRSDIPPPLPECNNTKTIKDMALITSKTIKISVSNYESLF